MKLFRLLVMKTQGGYQGKFVMFRKVFCFTAKNQQFFNTITQIIVT